MLKKVFYRKDGIMIIAKVRVGRVDAKTVFCEKIPRRISGAKVEVEYTDPMWDKLSKVVVFQGSTTKDVIPNGNLVTIPAEVVRDAGRELRMGIYGTNTKEGLAIPTLWVELGRINGAANPSGDTTTNPALPVWGQIQNEIGDLQNLSTQDKDNLVSAVNEIYVGGQEALENHENNTDIHVSKDEKDSWNSKTSVQVDASLTQEGYAADAMKTGTALEDLRENLQANCESLQTSQKSHANDTDIHTTAAEKAAVEQRLDIMTTNVDTLSKALIITQSTCGETIAVNDSAQYPLQGLKIYGKTTQNGTPTPDAPVELVSVGAGGTVGVRVCGKNLLRTAADFWTSHGITYTKNEDGSFSYSGTSIGNDSYCYFMDLPYYSNTMLLKAGTYVLSAYDEKITVIARKINADETFVNIASGVKTAKFTLTEATNIWIAFFLDDPVSGMAYSGTFYPQLELGSTATDYEPYRNGGTVTAQTPNGLPGIPVTSGGNYTDENGQMWVCDEIDFARCKYVKRLDLIENYSGEAITTVFMSTTGELTSGAKVIYALGTPIETDLTAEELAEYVALTAQYPNTIVLNHAGAAMKLDYVADTKIYIDNKLAAIVSNN